MSVSTSREAIKIGHMYIKDFSKPTTAPIPGSYPSNTSPFPDSDSDSIYVCKKIGWIKFTHGFAPLAIPLFPQSVKMDL